MNFIFHFIWLLVPALIFLIAGIFVPLCLYIGLGLILLDLLLSIVEQLQIRKTILTDSDNEDFRSFQDAIFKDGNWVQNVKDMVEEKIEENNELE